MIRKTSGSASVSLELHHQDRSTHASDKSHFYALMEAFTLARVGADISSYIEIERSSKPPEETQ